MLISWPGFSADMDLRGAFWSTGGRKWGTNWSRHWCWVTQWRWPTAGSWGTHTVLGWFVWLWLAKKKLKNLRNGFLGGVVSRTFYDFHPNSWGDVKIWGIFCNCIEPTMVRSVAPSEVLKLPKGMMMPQLPNPSGYLISPCLLFTLPPIIMFQLENGCTLYIISNMNVSFHFFWVGFPTTEPWWNGRNNGYGICLDTFENVTSLGWSMFRGGVRASGSTAGISSLKPAAGFECTSGVT